METKPPSQRKNKELLPAEDLIIGYANHIFLEPSFWDLKMIFGQIDQSVEPLIVDQHTAITVPWAQAKIFSYFLRAQIVAHEATLGKIPLNNSILPQEATPPSPEALKADPDLQKVYEALKKLREQFIAELV